MESKPLGRPSKYVSDHDMALIAHMSEGYSYESFAALLNVHIDTLYEWEKKHDSFSEAKKVGRAKSMLMWEKMGLLGTLGKIKGFNSTAWIFNLKNRFGWTDRQDVTSDGEKLNPIVIYRPEKLTEEDLTDAVD